MNILLKISRETKVKNAPIEIILHHVPLTVGRHRVIAKCRTGKI